MKTFALIVLAAVPLLAGCRHPQPKPDYDAVRQHADQSQGDLNRQGDVPNNK
jgi:hypothetical protein